MLNDTLPVGIIVEVDHPQASFLAKIVEVSATHVLDDVWYRVEPIPGEQDLKKSKPGELDLSLAVTGSNISLASSQNGCTTLENSYSVLSNRLPKKFTETNFY